MKRRGLCLALGLLALPARAAGDLREGRRVGLAFGTTFSIRALHAEPSILAVALDAAVAELRRMQSVLSLFDPASQVSRLNRDGVLQAPDPALLAVLAEARRIWAASEGGFDPTIQPLWRLWAAASAQGVQPQAAALQEVLQRVDFAAVDIGEDAVRFLRPGMGLTLNGIAQGYACDQVMRVLRAHGIADALVDTGEFGAMGRRGDGAPWQVATRHPRGRGFLADPTPLLGCLAVSGDDECAFTLDRSEHHILDPRTGHSPRDLALLVVRAPSAALADGLSTAGFVLGPEQAQSLASRSGATVEAWVTKGGEVQRPG